MKFSDLYADAQRSEVEGLKQDIERAFGRTLMPLFTVKRERWWIRMLRAVRIVR